MTEQPPYGGQGQPPYGYQQQGIQQGQAAGLGERFLARLLDGLIFGVGLFLIMLVVAAIGLVGSGGTGFAYMSGDSYGETAVVTLAQTVVWLGYYVFLETSRGQTLGKMVLKLRVVNQTGGHPTLEQSVKRNIFIALGLLGIVPILGFIGGLAQLGAVIAVAVTISSDPANRGWHDKLGDTQVLKTA